MIKTINLQYYLLQFKLSYNIILSFIRSGFETTFRISWLWFVDLKNNKQSTF